jgi:hypothetical protein
MRDSVASRLPAVAVARFRHAIRRQRGCHPEAERASYDAAKTAFDAQHTQFRPGGALPALRGCAQRGAFRNDKTVSAQLGNFKRSAVRKGKKAAASGAGSAGKPTA